MATPSIFFFFQAEDGIRDLVRSRGLGDVYKRQIQTTEDDRRQLTVTIEVEESRVQKAMQAKARELSREIQLPGFRPGKAPYDVVVRRIGEDTLRGEACLLYTSPSPRDRTRSRMPSSA